MKNLLFTEQKALHLLAPETELERAFLRNPEFNQGLFWGKPRFGHPEGKVIFHIREVLDNVDKLNISAADRQKLRIITFVHDTFKYKEHRGTPRDWTKHHAVLARQFLEQYTDNQLLLDLTEFHDEAYYVWQKRFLHQNEPESNQRLSNLYQRFNGSLQLYYLFFKCDTCTGDKNPAPMKWVENTFTGIDVICI